MARRGGWRRLGRRRFRYVDSRGRPIADEERLERIRSLAIPPAWDDVWISPNPSADLQATGVDSAGRRQYIYSERRQASRRREKFDRLLDFARGLPTLRASAEHDLRRGPYEPEWACAIAIGVVNKAWFRVGSDRHTRSVADVWRHDPAEASRRGHRRRDPLRLQDEEQRARPPHAAERSPLHGSWDTSWHSMDHGCSGSSGTRSSSRSPRSTSTTTSASDSGTASPRRISAPGAGRSLLRASSRGTARRRASRTRGGCSPS